jgi:hypothetical protein
MKQFEIGDRVRRLCDGRRVPLGTTGTVADIGLTELTVKFDNGVSLIVGQWDIDRHVDQFPIAADKDPWRESEPNEARIGWQCGAALPNSFSLCCSREPGHGGYHLCRTGDRVVRGRWPQESASPSEKIGPVVGLEVVATRTPDYGSVISQGDRGHIDYIIDESTFHVDFPATGRSFNREAFGDVVIPAAEWNARQKRGATQLCGDGYAGRKCVLLEGHTGLHCSSLGGDITGPAVATTVEAARKIAIPVPAVMTGDLNGPPRKYRLTEAFTAKLAIALFEADNAGTVARVADDGRGGIGTEEAMRRLVWRTTESQRAAYMREAEALLTRAGELA